MTSTSTTTEASSGSHNGKSKFSPTWHHKPWAELDFFRRTLISTGILQDPSGSDRPPVFPKDAPVPVHPVWAQHAWVFPRAILPLLVHAAITHFAGIAIPALVAGPIYFFYFFAYGAALFRLNSRMGKKYGFFDGTAERDGIPDSDTTHVAVGLANVILLRCIFAFAVIYKPDEIPLPSLWLPVQLAVYAIITDFWFYWYHRLMHEVPQLWRFHRKHHTTKHPNAALGAYADHEQELFDILVIPVLTWLVFPVNFATWWISTVYILYIEASGHSGIRGYFQNPTVFFLRYIGCELCLEDHDLHHRQGWKKSGNYGKQTRLWDALFGTMKPRIEGTADKIDWNSKIYLC